MKRVFVRRNGELIEITHERRPSSAPFIIPDLPEYQSPIDGKVISGRAQRREDLKRNGCRPWEGREQETKEAARQRQYAEQRLDHRIEESARRSFYELPPDKRRMLTG